jgi:hypothetical protein
MIIRNLKKRLSKAEVHVEFNDPDKVVIRDIVDYYNYLDNLGKDPGLDKKELVYKPRRKKSSKETFCDVLIKHDRHYAGYVGDESVKNLSSGKPYNIKLNIAEKKCENTLGKSIETDRAAGDNFRKQTKGLTNIQPIGENEPAHEKMRRRKALECCGSFD